MLTRIKSDLSKMKRDRPGDRFRNEHRRASGRGLASGWLAAFFYAAAAVCAAIGVVLAFIPGPAFVFFILAGALVATQSRVAARALDRCEIGLRDAWEGLRARLRRR